MGHDKALIINKFWASVLASVIGSAIIGGVAYAWTANANIAVLQNDVRQIQAANLDTRLTRMEEQIKASAGTVDEIKKQQNRMDDKLDRLLSR